jgi:hypothetical protein
MQAYLAPREAFFLLSAHRFFIISEIRFLPSAVRWRRLLALGAGASATGDAFGEVGGKSVPSKATIAVFSRSRSRLNSLTIAWISNCSSVVILFYALALGQSSMVCDNCRGMDFSAGQQDQSLLGEGRLCERILSFGCLISTAAHK